MTATLVWFRYDLRLHDNPALHAAVALRQPIIPLYIWFPDDEAPWSPGAASRWWLHHSLRVLDGSLRRLGSRLILRKGPVLTALDAVVRQTAATRVFWNRDHLPALSARDAALAASLCDRGLVVESFNASLLFEPDLLLRGARPPYRVFTPFWRACLSLDAPATPLKTPSALPIPPRWPCSLDLADLALEPRLNWAAGLRAAWIPGEAGAETLLQSFLADALTDYSVARDFPGGTGTSRLSPHLHFGEISPRRIWHAACAAPRRARKSGAPSAADPAAVYLRQLGWREFAGHLLHHFPHTANRPLRAEFEAFPWSGDDRLLRAWEQGRTGYPIVDAGMRELWATGWMHNRVRMIVASFLVKDLLISWRDGARWFWDTLVDADLANNTLGWQWTAGCGADAAPFFRVFNPVLQGEKFDPGGVYVRRWIPELAGLPDEVIHRPWTAAPSVLARARVTLGTTYPEPLVDHAAARARALALFARIKRTRR